MSLDFGTGTNKQDILNMKTLHDLSRSLLDVVKQIDAYTFSSNSNLKAQSKEIKQISDYALTRKRIAEETLTNITSETDALIQQVKQQDLRNRQERDAHTIELNKLSALQRELQQKAKLATSDKERHSIELELNSCQEQYAETADKIRQINADIALNANKVTAAKKTEAQLQNVAIPYLQKVQQYEKNRSEYLKESAKAKAALDQGLINKDEYAAKQRYLTEQYGNTEKEPSITKDDIKDDLKSSLDSYKDKFFTKTMGVSASTFGDMSKFSKITSVLGAVNKGIQRLNETLGGRVSECLSDIASYSAKLNTRLYGSSTSTKSFQDILSNVSDTGMSRYVDQKKLLDEIASFSDQGVLFNLENRALLSSIKDQLVTTFDALDANLLRLTRLQQFDMTQQQLGTESLLTEYLNSMFKDSSYMTDMYDSVYGGIVDAMSTMDSDQATQFNFNTQKWLAALYSVGMSQQAVSSIASALNALATGDLSSLSGTSAETLLALTANKAGKSYADYLVQGMNGNDANEMLAAMVTYLQDIANNTDSKVVRSQWSEILGLTNGDWKAITNLTSQDIASITNYTATQQTVLDEVSNLLNNQIDNRTPLSTQLETAWNNATYSYSMGRVEDTSSYLTYKIAQFTNSLPLSGTGGFLDTALNVIGAIANIGDMINGLSNLGKNFMSSFVQGNVNAYTDSQYGFNFAMNRGDLYEGALSGSIDEETSGKSSSGIVDIFKKIFNSGNASTGTSSDYDTGDISTVSTGRGGTVHGGSGRSFDEETPTTIETSATEQQNITFQQQENAVSATYKNVTNEQTVTSRSIADLYNMLFEEQSVPIRVKIASLEDATVAQLAGQIYTAQIYGADTYSALNSARGIS